MKNPANVIAKAAAKEGLGYWDYVKKHQNKKDFGFRYVKVDTAALIEEKERQRAEKKAEAKAKKDS
jgi:hypothetical protein